MASPQKEHGYTAIANEILEHLVKAHLLGSEWDIIIWIIRKTYGHHKQEDWISLTQFEKATELSRPTVVKALKNLVANKILVNAPLLGYKFNKNWEIWGSKRVFTSKGVFTTSGKGALTETSKGALTHKRKKETITKESIAAKPPNEVNLLLDFFKQTINPHIKFNNKTERLACEDLINTYGLEKVKAALGFLQQRRQTDKFLPIVTTPYELWTKWAKIKQYLEAPQGKKGKIWA